MLLVQLCNFETRVGILAVAANTMSFEADIIARRLFVRSTCIWEMCTRVAGSDKNGNQMIYSESEGLDADGAGDEEEGRWLPFGAW